MFESLDCWIVFFRPTWNFAWPRGGISGGGLVAGVSIALIQTLPLGHQVLKKLFGGFVPAVFKLHAILGMIPLGGIFLKVLFCVVSWLLSSFGRVLFHLMSFACKSSKPTYTGLPRTSSKNLKNQFSLKFSEMDLDGFPSETNTWSNDRSSDHTNSSSTSSASQRQLRFGLMRCHQLHVWQKPSVRNEGNLASKDVVSVLAGKE